MKARERIVVSLAFVFAIAAAAPVLAADPSETINAKGAEATVADEGSTAVGSDSLNGNTIDADTRTTTLNTNLTANGNNTGEQVTDSGNGNNLSRNETETRTTTVNTDLEAEGNNTGTQVTDSGNGNNLSRNESETQTTTNSADNKAIVANDDSDVYSMNDSFNRKEVDIDKTEVELNFNLSNTRAADGSAAATGGDASVANSNNTAITNTAGDNGIVASTGADVDADYNSNNRNEAEEGSVAVLGSGSATVDSSRHDSHDTTITIKDVTVEVASSDLEGTVSGNHMTFDKRAAGPKTGATTLDGHALSSASGIVVLSQNTGMTSMVQQSVNVQVNK